MKTHITFAFLSLAQKALLRAENDKSGGPEAPKAETVPPKSELRLREAAATATGVPADDTDTFPAQANADVKLQVH